MAPVHGEDYELGASGEDNSALRAPVWESGGRGMIAGVVCVCGSVCFISSEGGACLARSAGRSKCRSW